MRHWIILAMMTVTAGAFADQADISVIYGEDNRQELYEVEDNFVQMAARATVGIISRSDLQLLPNGKYAINGTIYGEELGLCRNERFFDQKMYGFCSGVLVERNQVLTAGHCIEGPKDCAGSAITLDMRLSFPGQSDLELYPAQIRRCKRVIKRSVKKSGVDFALIELDEPVRDRHPIRMGRDVSAKTSIFMVGFPWGLPQKFVGESQILSSKRFTYLTNLDSASGNSGSPVFDEPSGQLIGILTEGEEDFVTTPKGCKVSKVCNQSSDCIGESVFKIDHILKRLEEAP